MPKPNGPQFKYTMGFNDDWDPEGENLHHITASIGDNEVGYLGLAPSGRIGYVYVDMMHRGKGVADSLLEHAMHQHLQNPDNFPKPVHSDSLTPEGYKFAKRNWWAGQVSPEHHDDDAWNSIGPQDITYNIRKSVIE